MLHGKRDGIKKEYNPQITQIAQIKRMENAGKRDPHTYAIIGAAMEAHKELGSGFLEPVYQEALSLELTSRDIPFQREVELPIYYKGVRLNTSYRADFICFEELIVELKALRRLTGNEESQLINYLKATGFEVGLLINFGAPSLEYKRFASTKPSADTPCGERFSD